MAVPVSNAQRLTCAAKRSGASPTILRAALVRETYTGKREFPLWEALGHAAGVEVLDDSGRLIARLRHDVLNRMLALSGDELTAAAPEMVAQVLLAKRDLSEGVEA